MDKTAVDMPHLASRIFGTPLCVSRPKLDAVLAALGPRLGVAAPATPVPAAASGFEATERDAFDVRAGVATISVVGTLVARGGGVSAMSGLTSYPELKAELDRALADPKVDGVLIDVDSGGGEVGGLFDVCDAIFAARATKPIYAVANESALSAAYALASSAERLFVAQTGLVGSIGVVGLHLDESKADEKAGLTYTFLHAGARKVDGNPHEPLSDEARAAYQAQIDQAYGVFVAAVARNRGLSEERVRATEAAVFCPNEALAAGLADEVGGLDEARAALELRIAEGRMLKQLQEQVSALSAENTSLKSKITALGAEADARWLEGLRARSAELQAPIDAATLAKIEAQLKGGNRAAAEALGDLALELSRSKAQKPVAGTATGAAAGSSSTTVPLVPPQAEQKTSDQILAAHLTALGWNVTLSPDGKTITSSSPGKKE